MRNWPSAVRWKLRYRGDEVFCPLCEKPAHEFLPNIKETAGHKAIDQYQIVSMGKRAHYRCPWCGSTDKERLVWWYLETILAPGQRVLHVAPEVQTRRRIQAIPGIEYVSGDKFYGNERYHDGRYEGAAEIDITDLPYADESFDIIICNHVLEHVEDDRRALSELYRVVKPNGKAILQVPVSYQTKTIEDTSLKTEKEREQSFGQIDHVRIYGTDYPTRLEEAGFTVTDIAPEDRPDLSKYGVNPREHLYIAERRTSL